MVDSAAPDEGGVAQAVEVAHDLEVPRPRRVGFLGAHRISFGPAHHGADEVQQCGAARAAGQHEGLERWQASIGGHAGGFEAIDLGGGDAGNVGLMRTSRGGGEVAAEIEQIVLDEREFGRDRLGEGFEAEQTDHAVGFIDGADGIHERAGFGNPAAVDEGGSPLVAGAGGDRVEIDHAASMASVASSPLAKAADRPACRAWLQRSVPRV